MSKYIPWMIATVSLEWICKNCNGTGMVDYDEKTQLFGACPECDGEGHFSTSITVRELAKAITEFQK